MGKGEIARNEQFLLFPQCFQKACFPEASKGVIVWEWVNYNSLKSQMKLQLSEIPNLVKELCKEPIFETFPKRQILDSPILKVFADNNFTFDENGRKFTQMAIENTVGKGEIACYE